MDRLFSPRSIAVVGASPNPGKIGNVLMRNLAGFKGGLYPVHPSASAVMGRKAFPSVSTIGEAVDLALLAIPQTAVAAAIRDCANANVRAAIVYSGGWAETGDAGRQAQDDLLRSAGQVRILGPNTSGFINPMANVFATFVADIPEQITAGPLTIIAQSGGVNISLCYHAQNEGLGIRLGVGLGNACNIELADVVDWAANDSETKVVAVAVEGIRNGRACVAALKRLTARIPVVAMVGGVNAPGAFAESHTGVLAGSYKVRSAALRQAGAVVVDTVTDLIDAAFAMSKRRLKPVKSVGVGVVTGQAGPGILLADALISRGLRLPTLPDHASAKLSTLLPPLTYQKNPVDTGRPGETFAEVLRVVRDTEEVDLLAVSLLHEPDAVDTVAALRDMAPAVLCAPGPLASFQTTRTELGGSGIPVYPTPERTANVVAALASDAHHQWKRISEAESSPRAHSRNDFNVDEWDEASAKEILGRVGIATPRRAICRNHEEAFRAFAKIGAPAVVKLLHPAARHKSEMGGVHLNIRSRSDLDSALHAIDRTVGAHYLIEEMVEAGPELIVGARYDDSFGPLVMLGAGGVAAEVEADTSIRIAPVSTIEAAEMLSELSSAARYRGFRGGPIVDEQELASIIQKLGDLLVTRADIAEIEINPLRVLSDRLIALDALVIKR